MDYHVHIKTSAETQALQQTSAGLQDLSTKAKAAGINADGLDKELREVNVALAKSTTKDYAVGLEQLIQQERAAGRETGELERRLRSLHGTGGGNFAGGIVDGLRNIAGRVPGVGLISGAMSGLGVAVSATAAACVAFFAVITKGLTEFAEAQKSTINLNSALASTGQFTEAASRDIQELAKEYQRFTGVSDETWQQAAAVLLQFGIQVNELPKYFPVIEALAGRMGGNVPAAAEAFAKAINGNFRPLQQLGIYIKDANTEQERFEALQKAAASGAGVLRAQNEGLAGSWAQVSTAIGDAWEALGEVANAAGVTSFFQSLAATLRDVTAAFTAITKPVKEFFDILPAGNDSLKKLHEGQNKAAQSTERVAQRTEELKLKMDEGSQATDAMGGAVTNLVPPLDRATTAAASLTQEISKIDKAGALLRQQRFDSLGDQAQFEETASRLKRLRANIDDVFESVGALPPAANASAQQIYLLAQSLGEVPREKIGGLLLDFIKLEGEIGKVTHAREKEIAAIRERQKALLLEMSAESTSAERRKTAIEEFGKLEKQLRELLTTQGKAPTANEQGLEKWLIDTAKAAGVSASALAQMLAALRAVYSAQANAPARPAVNPRAPYGGSESNYIPGPTGPIYVAPAGPGLSHGGDPFWRTPSEGGPAGVGQSSDPGWGRSGIPGSTSWGIGEMKAPVEQASKSAQAEIKGMVSTTVEGFKDIARETANIHRQLSREISQAKEQIAALWRTA